MQSRIWPMMFWLKAVTYCATIASAMFFGFWELRLKQYLRVTLFIALITIFPKLEFAQSSSGAYTRNFAKVKIRSGKVTSVPVRAGAGSDFRRVDRLRSGQEIYICDERGEWFKASYSEPSGPCGPTSENGLNMQKVKACRSGWVQKKWIDVISG